MSKRRTIGAVVSLALIASGTTIAFSSLTASGATAYNRATTTCGGVIPGESGGYDNRPYGAGFIAQVDSIKSYAQPVSAHRHAFYSRHDISSTMSAKIPLNSAHFEDPGWNAPAFDNCKFYTEWNGQWFPTPLWNGAAISPGPLRNTQQSPAGTHVEPEPFGEVVVVGNAFATSEATMDPHVRFTCGDGTGASGSGIDGPGSPKPMDCRSIPGGLVTAEITYPDCWDGKQGYDPATHTYPGFDAVGGIGIDQKHFSFSVNGKCPDGMVPCVPAMRMEQLVTQQTFLMPDGSPMRNPYNADGTLGLSFSSGPYWTYHGDYINSSGTSIRNSIVQYCLNQGGPAGHGCPAGQYIGTIDFTHQLD